MEIAKLIIDLITSCLILGGVICGLTFFKHKTDDSVRKLYLDSIKKVDEIFHIFYRYGHINDDARNMLFEAYEEASLYLHQDIVNYIETIKNLMFEGELLNIELDNLPVGDDRNRNCQKQYEIKMKIHDLYPIRVNLYRKHIVQDSFFSKTINKFLNLWKKICNQNLIKERSNV